MLLFVTSGFTCFPAEFFWPDFERLSDMEKLNEERVLKGNRFDVHRMTLRGDDGQIYHREVLRHPRRGCDHPAAG